MQFFFTSFVYNLYLVTNPLTLQGIPGVAVGGLGVNGLRCAGDIVLMAEGEEQLQELVDVVATAGQGRGIGLSGGEIEMMVIAKR